MTKVNKFWHIFNLAMTRIVFPILILFALGSIVSIKLDQFRVRRAPTSEFLKYSSFTATGAYEGENVNFTVCREFKDRYRYDGDLKILIVNESRNEKPIPVYSRPIDSTFNGEPCENKQIRQADFHHTPGSYRMSFRVCIAVKYGYVKCTDDIESNVYRIRVRPEDADSLIEYYQSLIDQLTEEGRVDPSSLANPGQKLQTPAQPNVTNNTTNNNTTNNAATNEQKSKPIEIGGVPICIPFTGVCLEN